MARTDAERARDREDYARRSADPEWMARRRSQKRLQANAPESRARQSEYGRAWYASLSDEQRAARRSRATARVAERAATDPEFRMRRRAAQRREYATEAGQEKQALANAAFRASHPEWQRDYAARMTEEQRSGYRAATRARLQTVQDATRAQAGPRRAWTANEDSAVLRDDVTVSELAFMLRRSLAAVTQRRKKLRKEARMPARKPKPAQPSRWPIYDAVVAERGFDPCTERIDNGIAHAREIRKDER